MTRTTALTRRPLTRAILLGVVGFAIACGEGNTADPVAPTPPTAITPPTPPAPPPGPPAGTISGSAITAYHGVPIPNATVAVDGIAAVTTDAAGNYSLLVPEIGTRRVVISADGHQYRETYLRTGETRAVTFDLIPNNGTFPLKMYREMARNTHEQPNNPQPIQRWTMNPNFHIETMWRDTGAPIDPAVLQYFANEIRRVVPMLTDNHFQAGRIEFGPERWDFVQDYVSIHWDHSGNYGVLGRNPGQVQFASAGVCQSIAIIHEIGHAMGYWHSSTPNTVMGAHVLASCNLEDLRPDELQVARAMYNRPVGNVDPDRDPQNTQVYAAGTSAPQIVWCDLPTR
jgi:hypothetical protein